MLRSVTVGVALSILATACALVEPPPPPPGTVMFQADVRNATPDAVELAVTVGPSEVFPGAVQPALLPAGSTAKVTFWVPLDRQWWIAVKRTNQFAGSELSDALDGTCSLSLEITLDGPESVLQC